MPPKLHIIYFSSKLNPCFSKDSACFSAQQLIRPLQTMSVGGEEDTEPPSRFKTLSLQIDTVIKQTNCLAKAETRGTLIMLRWRFPLNFK